MSRALTRVMDRIKKSVLDHEHVFTTHAESEMKQDRLDFVDVESALLTGTIERVFEHDPRGLLYEVVGSACDLLTRVGVVVRVEARTIIITVYEIKP